MKLPYDLLIAESAPPRCERINIGLVIWRNGMPEIVFDATKSRLSAIDPNFPRLPIFRQLADGTLMPSLHDTLTALPSMEPRRSLLGLLLAPIKAVPGGELFAEDGDFSAAIERLMNTLVRRQQITVKAPARKIGSRLEIQFKQWLRHAKILGHSMEDLSRHRVVSQFPVSVEADVYADFAYKNGALHVLETLDLRGVDHVTSTLRNTAAYKSLTLDMARDVVGENGQRIGIVAASDYSSVKSAMRLFERNADRLFSLDSPSDAQSLADLLAHGLHIDGGLIQPSI
jgi:hypothetical protein